MTTKTSKIRMTLNESMMGGTDQGKFAQTAKVSNGVIDSSNFLASDGRLLRRCISADFLYPRVNTNEQD